MPRISQLHQLNLRPLKAGPTAPEIWGSGKTVVGRSAVSTPHQASFYRWLALMLAMLSLASITITISSL